MRGAEFAALVKTLPEAEQRKIEAVIDLFLEDRRSRYSNSMKRQAARLNPGGSFMPAGLCQRFCLRRAP